ncbi:MAG: hypothetical protein HKP32_13090 [Woeseia sp.]|nr:hypothetical protein [Woeseia sp.]
MDNKTWLLYGANGYSGERAARAAKAQGHKPVLAGRNEIAISKLAKELDLPFRIFGLENTATIQEHLWDIAVVVHAAGPFSATSEPMIKACIASRVHYVDITGEVEVFERAQRFDKVAKQAGVVVCPGVGFDVIPTDCVAAVLHEELPDAVSLTLGFHGNLRPSRGTAKTALEGASKGIFVRRDGKLQQVARDYRLRNIDFGNGSRRAAVIPWGDISTAYWTTSIPNISVYIPERSSRLSMKLFGLQKMLLSCQPVRKMLIKKIDEGARGPEVKNGRSEGAMFVWGEIRNAAGRTVEARLKTSNGYDVTVEGMMYAATHLLSYRGRGGYMTPSQLFGKRLIEQFEGCSRIEITQRQA